MNEPKKSKSEESINRRGFLKTTSSAVVGGSLLGSLSIEQAALGQLSSDTVRVALVGCGGRGTGAANQALSTQGDVKLVAMADAFRDRLDSSFNNIKEQQKDRVEVPEDQKFVGFDAYKLAISQADLVILATPPGFRPIHFAEAVRQGKHVFMEKPLATDALGVRQILEAGEEAKSKNLKVGVGLQRHHQLGYLETLKRLHDGVIGDIVSMRCYWNGSGVWTQERQPGMTEMEYQMRNWYYFAWLCGDHIVEQHIHNIDVINWVKQAHPIRCQGMGGREVRTGKDHGHIFDHHFVEFEYEDGTRCYSQCRHIPGCWSSVSEHVMGTKGYADVSGHRIFGANRWRFGGGGKNPYQQEHDDLFAAIREDKPYNEVEYAAHSTMSAVMGRMATYSGKVIEWDQALNTGRPLLPEEFGWDVQPPIVPDANGDYPVAVPGQYDPFVA